MTGSSSPPRDDEGTGPTRPSRRGGSRVLIVSMVVSAVIHAGVVMLYPVLVRRTTPDSTTARDQAVPTRFRATEVVRLAEAPEEPEEAPPAEPPEPEPEPEPEEEEEAPVASPEEEPSAPEAEEPSAAERLRPSEADPRIWRPVSPRRAELTDEERARIRIYGKLQAWNDSVAAGAELGPNTDWTFTDDEGRRWGLSPGKLHLGGLTLPMPAFWGAGSGSGDLQDALEREWELRDIESAANRALVREILKDRAEAIRERKDRERRERADTTGGGG